MALGLALLLALPLTERTARGEVDLRWDAPAGCPGRDEVRSRLRKLAGSVLDQTEGMSAEGVITRVAGRFDLTLLVRDGSEVRKRVITSNSCPPLAGAAAVTLAILLGVNLGSAELSADDLNGAATGAATGTASAPDGREGEEPGGRAKRPDEPSPPPPAAPVVPGNSASTASTTTPGRWAATMRLPAIVADLGPLPRASLGLGIGVGIRYESWRVMLAGSLFSGQTVEVPDQGGALGAELKRMAGHVGICRGWSWPRFEVAPCVGLSIEHMTSRGFGEGVTPRTQQSVWLAPSAGVVAHWHAMESLAFFAGVNVYLELSRPHIVIDGIGEVAQLGQAAAGIVAGLEWSFPGKRRLEPLL